MDDHDYYPELGLHFEVSFGIPHFSGADAYFQEVSGISVSISEDKLKSVSSIDETLPNKTSYSELVLKRGLMQKNSPILLWFDLSIEKFKFVLIDILVILNDENENMLVAWSFINVKPSKLSISGLNALKGEIVIEEMTFKYESFRRIPLFNASNENADEGMKMVKNLYK